MTFLADGLDAVGEVRAGRRRGCVSEERNVVSRSGSPRRHTSTRLRAQRRRAGSPMSLADSRIAGMARSRGYSLATLNTSDFRDLGLPVLEPR